MNITETIDALNRGKKVRLPHWKKAFVFVKSDGKGRPMYFIQIDDKRKRFDFGYEELNSEEWIIYKC